MPQELMLWGGGIECACVGSGGSCDGWHWRGERMTGEPARKEWLGKLERVMEVEKHLPAKESYPKARNISMKMRKSMGSSGAERGVRVGRHHRPTYRSSESGLGQKKELHKLMERGVYTYVNRVEAMADRDGKFVSTSWVLIGKGNDVSSRFLAQEFAKGDP